jgi:hypothetical protein
VTELNENSLYVFEMSQDFNREQKKNGGGRGD